MDITKKSENKLWIKGSVHEKMKVCEMEIGHMGEAQRSNISSWHGVRSAPNQAPLFLLAARQVTGHDIPSCVVLSVHPVNHLLDMPTASR